MRRWIIILITILMMIPLATAQLEDCEGPTLTKSHLPCLIISPTPLDCSTIEIKIFNHTPTLLRTATMGDYGNVRCNITFGISTNETKIGSYLFNWSNGDSSKLIVREDNNMLIALVIGISLIVALFIFLTFAVKDDKPFLANFFFLGIFIFATVLSFLLWKITSVNSAPYESVMFIVYRMMMVISMLLTFVVLLILTIDAVKLRKWKGNPVDHYRDNLGKNE